MELWIVIAIAAVVVGAGVAIFLNKKSDAAPVPGEGTPPGRTEVSTMSAPGRGTGEVGTPPGRGTGEIGTPPGRGTGEVGTPPGR